MIAINLYGPEFAIRRWIPYASEELQGVLDRLIVSARSVGGRRMATVYAVLSEPRPSLVTYAETLGIACYVESI